ncbi:MAG: hypothetical protein AB7S78_00575 [Candidatus Omnitrophota bacterium]
MPSLPPGLIIMISGLCLLAWFLIGERKNFWEKIMSIIVVIAIVVLYRLCNGDTLGNMLDIVRDFLIRR